MSKPLVLSVPCAANAVADGKWLKQDGAGAYAEADSATSGKGVSATAKDAQDRVGCVKIGLMTLTAKAATYNHGDPLELDATGQALQAETTNPVVAYAAETATLAADGPLDVLVDAR